MKPTGQEGAVQLFAQLIASMGQLGTSESTGASEFEATEHGLSAVVHLESSDRYRVTIDWLGDGETA